VTSSPLHNPSAVSLTATPAMFRSLGSQSKSGTFMFLELCKHLHFKIKEMQLSSLFIETFRTVIMSG